MFFASHRSVWRLYRGQRPRPSDLDTIVRKLRKYYRKNKPRRTSKRGIGWSSTNPEGQTSQFRRLQLRKLKNTIAYVYEFSPYYQKKFDAIGIKPEDILALEDINKLPLTYKSDIQQYPDEFISQKPGLSPIQVFKTSGTTGEPLMIYISLEELHYYVAGEAIMGLLTGGMRPNTIFQIHLPLDTSATAFLSTMSAQMAGALVLNQGWSGSAENHVKSIFKERKIPGKDKKVSVLFASPAYLWALTIKAEEMEMDFTKSGLKQIMTGGAMVTEQLKKRIRETWGVELSEGAGMVETPAHAGFECPEGRIHFLDLTGYIEVLNPNTQEPVGPGEEGVLVKTEFYPDVEMMPFIRYWTQDLVIAGSNEICPCGIPTSYVRDIVGRADQMVIVGAMNFYPQTIGDSLIGIPGLISPPRFHVSVSENEKGQIVILDVEGVDQLSGSDQEELRKIISQRIAFINSPALRKNAVEMKINILPPKSIKDVFSYKHQGPDLSSLQQSFNDN